MSKARNIDKSLDEFANDFGELKNGKDAKGERVPLSERLHADRNLIDDQRWPFQNLEEDFPAGRERYQEHTRNLLKAVGCCDALITNLLRNTAYIGRAHGRIQLQSVRYAPVRKSAPAISSKPSLCVVSWRNIATLPSHAARCGSLIAHICCSFKRPDPNDIQGQLNGKYKDFEGAHLRVHDLIFEMTKAVPGGCPVPNRQHFMERSL